MSSSKSFPRTMGLRGAALVAGLFSLSSVASAQSLVEWQNELDAGLATAQATKRLVLIDFSADWCAPCKEMDARVWTDPALAALVRQRVVPIRIDFDEEKKLAGRFKVAAIPMMIWTDPWGNEIGRQMGYVPAGTMTAVIEGLPADFGPVAAFHDLADRSDEPAIPLVRIASFYREKNLLLAADSFYEKALKASKNGKKEPQVAEQAYVGLGLNALAREEPEKARKLFEKAAKLPAGPNRANALYGLVAAYAKLGDRTKASERLEELRRAHPEYAILEAAEALVSEIQKR
jgi:tetratricopeptide (TPR) repeat protein